MDIPDNPGTMQTNGRRSSWDTALPPEALDTNYVPSAEEESLVRHILIPRHTDRLLDLDSRVLEARHTLRILEREQQKQKELLHAHEALLTPMRRLIPEILLEIFYYCHARNHEMAIRLASVCRRWRDLVFSTPTLWNTILLHDGMTTERIVPHTVSCIKHSRELPLKVVVKFLRRRNGLPKCRKAIIQALKILSQHYARWQIYHVFVDATYKLGAHIKLPGVAPLLEELVLLLQGEGATSQAGHYTSGDVPILMQCKRLRRFSIDDSAEELSLRDCWDILTHCRNLVHFETMRIKADSDEDIPEGDVELPELRVLCLGPFAPDPSPLIHKIKTPSLEHLRLLVGKSTQFDSTCFERLMDKCRPPLQTLSLVHVDGSILASYLHLLPELSTLTLQYGSHLDKLISRLTEKRDVDLYCPRLSYLALRLCFFRGSNLVRFARERKAVGHAIRVHVDAKSKPKFKEFTGLTIALSLVGEFSDQELKELYELQTITESSPEPLKVPVE